MTARVARVVFLAMLLAACAGAPAVSPTPSPVPTPTPVPTPSPSPTPPALSAACVAQLQATLNALEELDGRLNVGLTKVDYGTRLGDVSVEYHKIDIDAVAAEPPCLVVGQLLEDAFNEYVKANQAWQDCVGQSGNCDTLLQGHWSAAHAKLVEARRSFPK